MVYIPRLFVILDVLVQRFLGDGDTSKRKAYHFDTTQSTSSRLQNCAHAFTLVFVVAGASVHLSVYLMLTDLPATHPSPPSQLAQAQQARSPT